MKIYKVYYLSHCSVYVEQETRDTETYKHGARPLLFTDRSVVRDAFGHSQAGSQLRFRTDDGFHAFAEKCPDVVVQEITQAQFEQVWSRCELT